MGIAGVHSTELPAIPRFAKSKHLTHLVPKIVTKIACRPERM